MTYTCPVCFFDKLSDPPRDYNICDCCGTEFGNDDELRTFGELRRHWIASGARWFFQEPPALWNPWEQLAGANVGLPYQVKASFGGVTNPPVTARSAQSFDRLPLAKAA